MRKCGKCGIIKSENDFYSHGKRKKQSYCKECNKLWVRARYLTNKKYYDQKNRETRARNKDFVKSFLLKNPCIDCGESDLRVLDFDHKFKKKMNVSQMVHRLCSLERIQKEIEKCEIRCSNCHRKKTFERAGHTK